VSSSGGQWIQGDYNLCFSLGEIAIETHISNSVILTQGFHQESFYEIVELDKGVSKHNIKIYPNPTENSININCNVNEKIALTIQDVKGNIIYSRNDISGNETHKIDLSQLAQGIYLLDILLDLNTKQIYKIQKLN